MKPLLITLSTAVCTLAGWHLGSTRRATQAPIVVATTQIEATPAPVQAASTPPPLQAGDARAILNRLVAESGGEPRPDRWGPRFYAELQGLPTDQFGETIANLAANGGFDGRIAGQLLAGLWVERDLPAARAWMLGLKANNNGLAGAIFEAWRQADPAGMIDWIKNYFDEPGPKFLQYEAKVALADAAAKIDPEQGFRMLDTLPKDETGDYHGRIYGIWAQHDPAAATARALQEPDEKVRANAIMTIVSRWAISDPAAARASVEKLPDPILSGKALVSIGNTIGGEDAGKAVDFLATIPQTNKTREALQQNLAEWAESDLQAALGWAATREDESLGRWTFGKIATGRSAEKIERAIAALPPEQRAQATQRWQASRAAKNPDSK